MEGLSLIETIKVLYSKHLGTDKIDESNKKLDINYYNEIYEDKEKDFIGILCHTCGIMHCSNITMRIRVFDEKVEWSNFDWFSTPFHNEVKFIFNENQYIEVVNKLITIYNEVKNYDDYCKFTSERIHNLYK